MEGLVTVTIVTVIMMTYRRNSMERERGKKLDLIKKLVR